MTEAERRILSVPVAPERHKDVWVFAEVLRGRLAGTAGELLAVGRALADELGERLCAVLMGKEVARFAGELFERGADRALVLEHERLEHFIDELYAAAMAELVLRERPNKLLFPASILGRSFASSLAVRAHAGITADATSLSIDKGRGGTLAAVRPTFGGTLMATILCPRGHRPEIATVRPLAYPAAPRRPGRRGELVRVPFDPARFPARTRHLGFLPDAGGPDLSGAETVVAGGGGLGGPEGVELLKRLAAALGGAVGASRKAVDAGWLPYRHQIGLTGRAVRPKLYVAVGISGQVQHLAGMNSAETIVCIDTDCEAPMMRLADFAVQGDYRELVLAILRELEARGASLGRAGASL